MKKKFIMGVLGVVMGVIFLVIGICVKNTYALESEDVAVKSTDHFLQVNRFRIKNNSIKYGDKVYLDLQYTSSKFIASCSLWLKSIEYESSLYYPIQDFATNPYFVMQDTAVGAVFPGEYEVRAMTCFSKNQPNQYLVEKNSNLTYSDNTFVNESGTIQVEEEENKIHSNLNFVYFELLDKEVSKGDTVHAYFSANIDIKSILVSFYNPITNEEVSVSLKGVEERYFVVPSTIALGNYQLSYILMKGVNGESYTLMNDSDGIKLYQDGLLAYSNISVDFNQSFLVKDLENTLEGDLASGAKTYFFDNANYSSDIQSQIDSLDDTATIYVVADHLSVIQKDLFQSIQGTNRTLVVNYLESEWVFHGSDITNLKNVDVSLLLGDVSHQDFQEADFIKDLPEKTKVLTFSNNGELPGRALIRLKSTDLDQVFAGDDLYIYYYDSKQNCLYKVAIEVQMKNGYYEFYLQHNSSYLLTSKLLNKNYVSSDEQFLKLNSVEHDLEDKSLPVVLYFIAGLIVIAVVVLTIVMVRSRKRK